MQGIGAGSGYGEVKALPVALAPSWREEWMGVWGESATPCVKHTRLP